MKEVWKNTFGYKSIAITKRSIYGIFMKQVIYEMIERGQLHQLHNKWKTRKQNCFSIFQKGKPLSLQKLITPFTLILLGFALALIISFLEKIWPNKYKNNNLSARAKAIQVIKSFFINDSDVNIVPNKNNDKLITITMSYEQLKKICNLDDPVLKYLNE